MSHGAFIISSQLEAEVLTSFAIAVNFVFSNAELHVFEAGCWMYTYGVFILYIICTCTLLLVLYMIKANFTVSEHYVPSSAHIVY